MIVLENFYKLIKKKEFLGCIIALLCSFILFPTFFNVGVYPLSSLGPSWYSLDPSWQLTLNKVNLENLVWGEDFAFTYGPLSYFSTRIAWGVNKFHFILFDLFVLFNFLYIFYTSYLKSNNTRITTLLIFATTLLLPNHFGSGIALILTAFLIFWIRLSLNENKPLFYFIQIVLVVLTFFIKFNTGLVSFVFFFAGLIYRLIYAKDNKLLIASYFVSPFIFIFILSKVLHVSIKAYLMAGMEMVSGYNEIMCLNENYVNEFRFSLVIIFSALSVLLLKAFKEKSYLFRNLIVLFLFSSTIYIIYKQAFTRQDIQHILEFYKYVLLFILCLQDFHFSETGKNSNVVIISIVFIAIFFAKKREDHLLNLMSRITKVEYFTGALNHSDTAGIFMSGIYNKFPERVITKVGNDKVDAYPWNTQSLIENKLNFFPRPTFQSYTAYTPYLENLNFEYYNSEKAPKFVFYEYDAIDSRYPLFDEPKMNLVLLKNYQCIDTFGFSGRPVLLLEKIKNEKVSLEKIREYQIDTNTVIVPQSNVYYELFISSTLKGKLVSILHQAPAVYLVIRTKNGDERRYKTSKKLLESGIFLNRTLNSTLDFYKEIGKDSTQVNTEIESYHLKVDGPALFKNEIKIIEYKIN
ncbi:hypothetical protein [Aurantibacillus circumpalustris]|uniref:hypothetical protein n=1 Tax=Aurantibacillus circumpalustris TaxID=3036359 RepID=UPI00295B5585|nr:hypothetical protein [Aurantibacillus circumpalustris]